MEEKADAALDSSVQAGAFGANQGRSGGGYTLLTLFLAIPAIAPTLQEGYFVRDRRSCATTGDRDRLTSNGHAVSPPGQRCRVVSRTVSGGYYPIFNHSCMDGSSEVSRVDLLVSAPDRIALRKRAGGTTVACRHCPSRAIPRGEHESRLRVAAVLGPRRRITRHNTQDTRTVDQSPPLPLFYKDPVLLRFEEHADFGLVSAIDYSFAREAVAIPLCIGEFAAAMRHFPIVFAMDEQASPIALVGIHRNHNLFVDRNGHWHPGVYVPAYLRRYPFIGSDTPDKSRQLLAVDRSAKRCVSSVKDHAEAEPLFDLAGKPTETAQSAMAFCHAFQTDYMGTVEFGRALLGAKLLKPYHAQFRLPDGSEHQVNGFYVIDEKAFRALPAWPLIEWHAKGWLDLVSFHLASRQNFQVLLDLNAQRANERKALA